MGCDIHFYVERFVDGKWISADTFDKDESNYDTAFYRGRNYHLFAILANVRNGRGFAGCQTGEGFNPISEPKGVPADASPEVLREYTCRPDADHEESRIREWVRDGYSSWVDEANCIASCPDWHSASHFTLAELLAYDWTQTTILYGWVNGPVYHDWASWAKERGDAPRDYSGGVMGRDIRHVEEGEMQALIAKCDTGDYHKTRQAVANALANTYCRVSWTQPYHRTCETFWSNCIPRLLRLGTPDCVRIVFWFDN